MSKWSFVYSNSFGVELQPYITDEFFSFSELIINTRSKKKLGRKKGPLPSGSLGWHHNPVPSLSFHESDPSLVVGFFFISNKIVNPLLI